MILLTINIKVTLVVFKIHTYCSSNISKVFRHFKIKIAYTDVAPEAAVAAVAVAADTTAAAVAAETTANAAAAVAADTTANALFR